MYRQQTSVGSWKSTWTISSDSSNPMNPRYSSISPVQCCTESTPFSRHQQSPTITHQHSSADPISKKKLKEGDGLWENDVKWRLCQLPDKLTPSIFAELRNKPLANTAEQRRYWNHWLHFCQHTNPPLEPFFRHKDNKQTGNAFECYAAWVREGKAGRGARVGAQIVQVALRAVGTKFKLDHQLNPIYRPDAIKEYWKPLARMIEGYRRQDPPPKPKLAVPVQVATTAATTAIMTTNPLQEATNDLINIAFYFLLCVGEYTHVSAKKQTRTIQFRVQDITLWRNNKPLANTAPLEELLTADALQPSPSPTKGTALAAN